MKTHVEAGSLRPSSGGVHQHGGDGFTCDRRQDFAPAVIRTHRGGRWRRVDRRKNAGEWGKFVHRAEMVVLDIDDGQEGGPGIVTGVIPAEQDVAARLAALAPAPGMAIAEIGADCGWTAALLDHHLQGGRVVTVADTERLADVARQGLERYPQVQVLRGLEAGALGPAGSFDGLLSHRAVSRVPWGWVTRVRPGGRLCLPLRTGLGGSSTLLTLRVARDGLSASGRFLAGPAPQALWLREQRPGEGTPIDSQESPRASAAQGATRAPLWPAARLFAGLLRPDLRMQVVRGTAQFEGEVADRLRIHDHQASRAVVFLCGPGSVYEWGPRHLGTVLFDALTQWHAAGEPELQQLGVTITETEHTLWLGAPDGPSWHLPAVPTPTDGAEHHAT
ncbi:methyltransferase [Streptomyces sp. NPDC048275]|uniref:methyltransferase n=1 Tax=Streptomyces sp. NPDC048275 TaxID=3155629 RepID=UPI0033DD8DAA